MLFPLSSGRPSLFNLKFRLVTLTWNSTWSITEPLVSWWCIDVTLSNDRNKNGGRTRSLLSWTYPFCVPLYSPPLFPPLELWWRLECVVKWSVFAIDVTQYADNVNFNCRKLSTSRWWCVLSSNTSELLSGWVHTALKQLLSDLP